LASLIEPELKCVPVRRARWDAGRVVAWEGVLVDETDDGVEARLTEFFASATGGVRIGPDDDYFALGLVNSLLALEIVAFVERVFEVRVEVDDLDLDNFRTIGRIAGFVRGKWGADGARCAP
jgi:acyl carrier protein